MRPLRPLACALLVVSLLVAGCTGSSGGKADPDPFTGIDVQAGEHTGIIRGVVFDGAIVPLAGVYVVANGPDGSTQATTTNDVGAFGIGDLAPGTYFVSASKAGYETAQTTAEVEAGEDEPDPVRILLEIDPANIPYPVTYHFEGFLQCSVRVVITAYPCTAGYGDDVFVTAYSLDRVPDWIQSEMTWDSTQALGDSLSMVSECFSGQATPDPCPDGNLVVNRSEGSAPLIFAVDKKLAERFTLGNGSVYNLRVFAFARDDTDAIPEEDLNEILNETSGGAVPCIAWPAINEGCFRFTGIGVILQQDFDIYTNIFYGYAPPEGWTFIEDGEYLPS